MNLDPRPHYSNAEKHAFYESAAKRFKAELRLRGGTAAVHIENKNDEVFWWKVLHDAYPQGKFRFISGSRSIGGNMTSGCTQCLQYRDFLDRNFWIAIDSDYRYLSEEPNIDAKHFILQTYTYSFENHFCYWKNCQRVTDASNQAAEAYEENSPEAELLQQMQEKLSEPEDTAVEDFDFNEEEEPKTDTEDLDETTMSRHDTRFDWKYFLETYSRQVYPLLVWQLYLREVSPDAFPQATFHRLITLPVGAHSAENNGLSVLRVLKTRCHKFLSHLKRSYPDADNTWFEARCNAMGVRRDNCYLFVRGHQLYDMVVRIGARIQRKFEKEMLKELCFDEYEEIRKIKEDVLSIVAPKK
ncbi:MAG: DUF4435 domain-containing protein [Bacteroidales bacterium]|nr:DUF4435 domain-containing protein [Bacteroidales bacterium]